MSDDLQQLIALKVICYVVTPNYGVGRFFQRIYITGNKARRGQM